MAGFREPSEALVNLAAIKLADEASMSVAGTISQIVASDMDVELKTQSIEAVIREASRSVGSAALKGNALELEKLDERADLATEKVRVATGPLFYGQIEDPAGILGEDSHPKWPTDTSVTTQNLLDLIKDKIPVSTTERMER